MECGAAETGFDIFGRLGVSDADGLRVNALTKLEREVEEWAIVCSLRGGGHGA